MARMRPHVASNARDGDTASHPAVAPATAAAAAYSAALNIDGSAATVNWIGGSAPSEGGSSGLDIYTHQIIKTGSATFTVISGLSNAA